MMMHEPVRFTGLRGELRRDESLARHTSWRCGGAADTAYVPADRDDLAAFVRQLPAGEPILAVGLGSNLLVRDGGIRGTVLLLHAALNEIALDGALIRVEAGVASPKLARFAATHERGEAEFLAGVPGTVGGALAMNAGCYGGETWRHVAQVEVLTGQGALERRTPDDYAIGYRSVLSRRTHDDACFTAAWFSFPPGNSAYARGRIKALLLRRIETQPLNLPNAGSVFRNPPGDHAARLIESCGLKGFTIGGASVSEKHANFIVNADHRATAADIEATITHVHAVVLKKAGVDLELEVRIVGDPR
jgi:UDP-N-acetylenolpyruvoylglucosamine reductase